MSRCIMWFLCTNTTLLAIVLMGGSDGPVTNPLQGSKIFRMHRDLKEEIS